MKKYLVLGSCRVVNTIAYEIGKNVLLNRNDLWFTHYIQEHIQKIKHLFGRQSLPEAQKELFVRYEQNAHYSNHSTLKVGESLSTGNVELQSCEQHGALNVVVELPTIRYISIPMFGKRYWGHTSSLGLIRESEFNQAGGYSTDDEFLSLLNEFEAEVVTSLLGTEIAEAVNFVYVPHSPFIETKDKKWEISEQRAHIFELIKKHCLTAADDLKLPIKRNFLDVKAMIDDNGGVDTMLTDQNHYSLHGRKVAFKYLDALTE